LPKYRCFHVPSKSYPVHSVPNDFERDLSVTIQFFLVEENIEFSVVVAQVTYKEIEEMIRTVDRNGDGRISYSEFRLAWVRILSEHKANNK
jgi:hypothetical protein